MGLYDTRCAVTGISLFTADAVMVGLARAGAGYRPITLGVAGAYNGYGVLEEITEDRNTALLMAYFDARAADGRLVCDRDYGRRFGVPPRDIESLFGYFERNFCDAPDDRPALALDGRSVVYCMISKLVWDGVAAAHAPERGTVESRFAELFGDSPIAAEIYRPALHEVADGVRDLYAMDAFLRAHGIAWSTPDPEVHGMVYPDEETREFVREARSRFAGEPAVLDALDRYDAQQAALHEDD
ncbi:hypothetical protein Val02_31550 [Virgisporangium aliadipatigenens]|uniref:Uncharacterized protein n=1 Tax=Virgisporangium aliadipatigenens TaxID=741659 RepID=A0A8J4DQ64_9ACTN|nr:hypothetical protein [Virgisporangium aliadipatigenens]GIJ46269.1 hypothetical protein Val02_31550 [Virgisporangium aliadipatigenens]